MVVRNKESEVVSNYIQEQEKEDIQIVDIYWDRIYLHIQIAGESIYDKEYAIAVSYTHLTLPTKA